MLPLNPRARSSGRSEATHNVRHELRSTFWLYIFLTRPRHRACGTNAHPRGTPCSLDRRVTARSTVPAASAAPVALSSPARSASSAAGSTVLSWRRSSLHIRLHRTCCSQHRLHPVRSSNCSSSSDSDERTAAQRRSGISSACTCVSRLLSQCTVCVCARTSSVVSACCMPQLSRGTRHSFVA